MVGTSPPAAAKHRLGLRRRRHSLWPDLGVCQHTTTQWSGPAHLPPPNIATAFADDAMALARSGERPARAISAACASLVARCASRSASAASAALVACNSGAKQTVTFPASFAPTRMRAQRQARGCQTGAGCIPSPRGRGAWARGGWGRPRRLSPPPRGLHHRGRGACKPYAVKRTGARNALPRRARRAGEQPV